MRRDDISTADDLARVVFDETSQKMVIHTPEGGMLQSPRIDATTLQHYQTARLATMQTLRALGTPGAQTDHELLVRSPGLNMQKIIRAAERAKQKSKFKQVTKVTEMYATQAATPA